MESTGNKPQGSSVVSTTPLPPYFDSSSGKRYSTHRTMARLCALGTVDEVKDFLKSPKVNIRRALDVGGFPDGWSCLLYACRWLNADVISHLLKIGSDMNFCTTGGMTALMAIAVATNLQNLEKGIACAKILVDAGCNVSHPLTFCRRTVLTMAVSKGITDLVEFLLESGANPNLRDDKGETAFNIAVAGNMMEIAELLITYGANPYMKNLDGKRCHELAAEIDLPDAAQDMKYFLTRILNKVYKERYGNRESLGDMLKQVNRDCRPSINSFTVPQEILTAVVAEDETIPLAPDSEEESPKEETSDGEFKIYDETMEPTLSYEYEPNNSRWIAGGLVVLAALSIGMSSIKRCFS